MSSSINSEVIGEVREPERWRLRGVPTATALDEWSGILAATHLSFDIRSTDHTPAVFSGSVTRRRFGDLALLDCAASPFLGHRSESVMGERPESVFGFQFVRRGVELVREPGRQVALTAGDVVLWDGWQPTEVEVIEPFVKRTLLMPRDRVLSVCPRLADVGALPPLGESGAARLLVRYVNALAAEELEPAAEAAAADAALELLRAAVEPSVPTSRGAKRAALRASVRRYVRAHLQDPQLGPEMIARAHAISVRALHALFEDSDESVAGLVRHERLARCFEDLELATGGSVTEVAFRWGFRDAAHFSRVFKRAFGVTPSEVRVTALACGMPSARIGKESGAPALDPRGSVL
jgi:AraC family transcriptional activator of tynA and feaB